MKRLFTFLFALVTMVFSSAVIADTYKQVGSLNPYAYNVSAQVDNGNIALSYKLNAPADSTRIAIYCNGTEVGKQAVEDNTVGPHNVVVDLSSYTKGGKYTVGIRVFRKSYDAPFQLKKVRENTTDTSALCYQFYHPRGVAADRDPFSPHFGRILTNESMEDAPDEGYQSSANADKDGIYAFDATFSPIANGSSWAFKGGLEFGVRMSDGSTRAYTPNRIVISKDNRIFVSMMDDTRSPLYEVSPDLQTWTPIFSGDFSDGVIRDNQGNYVTGINCGLDVKGEGEDLEIIMLNTNRSGMGAYDGKSKMIATYKLGTKTAWTGPATTADTLSKIVGEGVIPVSGNCGIAYDNVEGYWYIGNRSDAIGQRSLCHVNANKVVDWAISKQDSALFSLNGNGLNGGGNARIIDDMFIIGVGQRISGTGHLVMLDIKHGENNVPILSPKYDLNLIGISRNLNDFAIDYGHNLYTIGNSNEMIVPVALPYSGMVETPVDAAIEITSSGQCGDKLYWSYDPATHALTITGHGEMDDFNFPMYIPWTDLSSEIESVILPEGLTHLGKYAFFDCNNPALTTIPIPSSVTSIGWGAFAQCTHVTSLTIPHGVTFIGMAAFRDTDLRAIIFPDGLTVIKSEMFERCSNLTSVTIPNSVDSIEDTAFASCSGLTSISLPDSLKFLGAAAFQQSGLTSIVIPQGVTELYGSTFQKCGQLAWVDIPASVKKIGWGDFTSCAQLKDLYVHWEDPKDVEVNAYAFFFLDNPRDITLHVPTGTRANYTATSPWNNSYFHIVELPEGLSPRNLSITENTRRKTLTLQWGADPKVVNYFVTLSCNGIPLNHWNIQSELLAPVDGKYSIEYGNLGNMNGQYELKVTAYDITPMMCGEVSCKKDITMFDNLGEVKVHALVPTDSDWDLTPGLWVCWWKNGENMRKDGRFVKMTDDGNRWYEATLNIDASTYSVAFVQDEQWADKQEDDPIYALHFFMQSDKDIYLDISSKQRIYSSWDVREITADDKDHNYDLNDIDIRTMDRPGRLYIEIKPKNVAPGYKVFYRLNGTSDEYKELVRWNGGTSVEIPFNLTTDTKYDLIIQPLDAHDLEVSTYVEESVTVYANPNLPTDLKAEVGKDVKTITFSWTPTGEEAVSYRLFVHDHPHRMQHDISGITGNEYTVTLMDAIQYVFWDLYVYNAEGVEIARVEGPHFEIGGMLFMPRNLYARMDGRTLICTWNVAGEWPLCHYALVDNDTYPKDTLYQADVQRENGEFRVEYTFERDTVMNLRWIVYTEDENHERVSDDYDCSSSYAIRGSSTEIPAPSKTCHLALSAGMGGYVNSCVNGDYAEGTYVRIIAYYMPGWGFKEWSDGSKEPARYIQMDQDTTLQAIFESTGKFTLSIGTYDEEKGTVNEEVCGDYDPGETVVIEGVPESGYRFGHWTDRSTEASREIVMDQNYTLWATFDEITYYSLTVKIEPDEDAGIVYFNKKQFSTNKHTYEEGSNVTLTAEANKGYTFLRWVEGENESTEEAYKVKMNKGHIVTAVFKKNAQGLEDGLGTMDDGRWTKILRDGQLLIVRDGKKYDVTGKRLTISD